MTDSAAAIAASLGKPTRHGTRWRCLCPAHDDSQPSLDIDISSDGRLLFVCRAGCAQADILAALTARGLWPLPDSASRRDDIPRHSELGKPSEVYRYHSAAGELVGVVCRWDATETADKSILPAVRATNGWKWKAMEAPRPLYGLRDLTSRPDAQVIIVEGERCRDDLAAMLPEFVVTTWAGGSQAVRKTDWTPLDGRKVVLWPDNDDPGDRAMATIAGLLSGRLAEGAVLIAGESSVAHPTNGQIGTNKPATSIKFIRRDPVKPKGWDVSDAIRTDGWNAERILAYARDRAEVWTAPTQEKGATLRQPQSREDTPERKKEGRPDKPTVTQPTSDKQASATIHQFIPKSSAQPEIFRGVPLADPNVDINWHAQLIFNEEGKLKPRAMQNFICMLRGHINTRGLFGYDEFANDIFLTKCPPWSSENGTFKPRPITDNDIVQAGAELEKVHLSPKKGEMADAISVVSHDTIIHPVKHYLDGLKWDGISRLPGCMWEGESIEPAATVYLGAENNIYTQQAFMRWMISAIARIYEPGCKADCAIVLEGPQGRLKSTALAVLGGQFFTDEIADFHSKDAGMQMQGVWIIEISELAALGKAEVERIKAFLSRRTDRFRPPYGRRVVDYPRSCLFGGTTNSDRYLQDTTGNRRFYPIACKSIDIEALKRDRDQLWAEALQLYKAGEVWWLTGKALVNAIKEQAKRLDEDTWKPQILQYLTGINVTTTGAILSYLNIEVGKQTRADATRVGNVMRTIEMWTRVQRRTGIGKMREYVYRRVVDAKNPPTDDPDDPDEEENTE